MSIHPMQSGQSFSMMRTVRRSHILFFRNLEDEVAVPKHVLQNDTAPWDVKKLANKGTILSRAKIGRCDSINLLYLSIFV